MPTSNLEAASELARMSSERGLNATDIARMLGKDSLWVWRRLNGKTPMRIDDYSLLKEAIGSIAPQPELFK